MGLWSLMVYVQKLDAFLLLDTSCIIVYTSQLPSQLDITILNTCGTLNAQICEVCREVATMSRSNSMDRQSIFDASQSLRFQYLPPYCRIRQIK